MGEEEKKSEEKAKCKEEEKPPEEAKKEEGSGEGEKKEGGGGGTEEKAEAPPPPPEEIIMRVYMHCEGCARKVKRCLKGFEGVEDVKTDSKAHNVVVKGKKAAENPMKVVDRVQKKTGRKVELLSPIPPPPPKREEKKKEEEEKKDDAPKQEEKKEPQVITVVLKVHMHCEACAQEIKKRILKMKGVQSAEPNLKASEVAVKGTFDPPAKLIEYVYKRTGKHATIVKTDPPMETPPADSAADADKSKDDKKDDKKSDEKKEDGDKKDEKKNDENAGDGEKKDGDPFLEEGPFSVFMAAKMLNELYQHQHYPRQAVGYTTGYAYNQYPPQIFSDENPNACSVM
ncbi:Heavy metal transport/detoxification superfamily protein [Rhynchospora pubera]|uniref:Heavy metal transport/detoxification superfamily protein n=1 Tax=Rhynchospora pubera TaxID=906938 RepID=A0AAV8HBG1_9POAL|nr:Heavy metal transport/detoxification superfamily protein [Rhynchospora pubera]